MRVNRILIVFLISLGIGCVEKNTDWLSQFQSVVDKLDEKGGNIETGAYLIVPNAGCKGCISSAESFLMEEINNENIKFMLTSIGSLKEIRMKLGANILESPNVIIDKNSELFNHQITSIYPIIFYVEDYRFKEYEFVSPDNPKALEKLKEKISH